MDFVRFLKANTAARVYPLKFPTDAPDTCIIAEITGGTAPRGTVSSAYVQIYVRALQAQEAERLAGNLITFLDRRTNSMIGDKQLVLSEAQQSEPQYVGTDENNRSLFSINVRLLIG
ncbi:MAG: hypothetical protein K0S71_329 [Clostridia bacterium]|jgi:hypothetical protein|nr:hypothetical protein [Clostridia bacterium]